MEGKISARYSRNAKEESNRGHDVHRTTCMNQSRASVTTEWRQDDCTTKRAGNSNR